MKILDLLWSLNAVDIFCMLVMAGVIYLGRKEGIVVGVFRLIGVLCTVIIVIHYYSRLSSFIASTFIGKDASTEFFAFSLLSIVLLSICLMISKGWDLILKIKTIAAVDRIGSIVTSIIQGYFVCCLVFLAFLLSNYQFTTPQAKSSLSRHFLEKPAVMMYRSVYDGLIAKIFPGEELNKRALKLVDINPNIN